MKTKSVCIHQHHAEQAAEVLKALGHPIRLRILSLLSGGPTHVKGLAAALGVAQAIVSQQLRILRSCRLVAATTEDGHAVYRITEPHLFRMLTCVERCITERAERGQS